MSFSDSESRADVASSRMRMGGFLSKAGRWQPLALAARQQPPFLRSACRSLGSAVMKSWAWAAGRPRRSARAARPQGVGDVVLDGVVEQDGLLGHQASCERRDLR